MKTFVTSLTTLVLLSTASFADGISEGLDDPVVTSPTGVVEDNTCRKVLIPNTNAFMLKPNGCLYDRSGTPDTYTQSRTETREEPENPEPPRSCDAACEDTEADKREVER